MNTTIFLAQIWGPALVAISIGFFISQKYYVKVYRDIEKEPLAALVFGMVGMAAGIVHILVHNVWGTTPEFIISLLGWLLLIKSTMFIVLPEIVDKAGNWALRAKLNPISKVLTLIVGVYIVWIGYFI